MYRIRILVAPPTSSPGRLSLSLPSSHSCFLTVHKPIITGAFSSVFVFFFFLALDPHHNATAYSISLFIGPCPATPESPPTTLCKESTRYPEHNPLINGVTYLCLKLYFRLICACIYWVGWLPLPLSPYSPGKASWGRRLCQPSLQQFPQHLEKGSLIMGLNEQQKKRGKGKTQKHTTWKVCFCLGSGLHFLFILFFNRTVLLR